MNPGTIMFIVLGVIGLLIYISKSLKPSSLENFSVIDESQISNKGKEGFDKLKPGEAGSDADASQTYAHTDNGRDYKNLAHKESSNG